MAPEAKQRPVASQPEGSKGHRITPHEAGTYLGCSECGRFLKIEWAVRSVVCSCGARLPVPPPDGTRS